jgi:hypothetical protein
MDFSSWSQSRDGGVDHFCTTLEALNGVVLKILGSFFFCGADLQYNSRIYLMSVDCKGALMSVSEGINIYSKSLDTSDSPFCT